MTISVYTDIAYDKNPPTEFDDGIDKICNVIRGACEGWGTDEKKLIQAICQDQETRAKVTLRYPGLHGKDLRKLMDKESSGDFGDALELLALLPFDAESWLIRKATRGAGTDERLLWSIICGRSNKDMECLKKAFFKYADKDLTVLLKKETGGDLEDFLIMCAQAIEDAYDPEIHTEAKAKEDAEAFYKAGEGKWGTNEKALFKLICTSPPEHLEKVNELYTSKYDVTLFKALEKEFRGKAEDAVVHALGMKLRPYETVAKLFKTACKGIGTDEILLTSAVVRYQNIMPQVNEAHKELYGKSIQTLIMKETGGDYLKLLTRAVDCVM